MKIELTEKEKKLLQEEIDSVFMNEIKNWDESKDPKGVDLCYRLFVKGVKITMLNGSVVTIKMTREKLKNLIGPDAYKAISMNTQADIMSGVFAYVLGLCCSCVFANAMKPNLAGLLVSGYGGWVVTTMSQPTIKKCILSDKINDYIQTNAIKEEVKVDDKGVQEAC